MSDMVVDYAILSDKCLGGTMSAEQFQSAYLDRFKNESRRLDAHLFELLDELFGDVYSRSDNQQLLASSPEFYLDEKAFRVSVQSAAIRMAGVTAHGTT